MRDYTLVEVNKDAVSVLDYVRSAMSDQGYTPDEIDKYTTEASKIDYDNLVSLSVDKLHEINQRRRLGGNING